MSQTPPDEPAGSHALLEPARPDSGGEERAFAQRLPWRWIAIGAAVIAVVLGGYGYRREAEASALRAQILRVHSGELAELGTRYTAFLRELEGLVTAEARRSAPERVVDPRLRIAALGSGQGLYLRVAANEATDPDKLAAAALRMESDAITRCLGVVPASARSLYALKGFLGPELVERANATTSVMGLRVIDDELRRRMVRDLPPVANLMRSDWFLLVLQRGENRRDHPVDVYLWDLRSRRKLLAVRTQANGLLVPVRIELPGVRAAPRPAPSSGGGGASDCSIAAQVKELTGEPSTRFGSDLGAAGPGAPATTGSASPGVGSDTPPAAGSDPSPADGHDAPDVENAGATP